MSERTPLLRAALPPRQNEKRIRKYAAIILSGFILYCVYLVLFLPRTSYQRDWNHLHGNILSRQEIERFIVKTVDPTKVYENAQSYYLSGPHMAGSGASLGEWTLAKFEDFGLKTETYSADAIVNTPMEASVRALEDSNLVFELDLDEDQLAADPPTELIERIEPFHPYAANGNVTGKLVYGNYGRLKDFAALRDQDISVTGRVLLVRSGKLPAHILVKNAKANGVIAVLVYCDDADDGKYTVGSGYKAYPEGPARNPSSVKRETVLDYTIEPGTIPKGGIPSLPISLNNAQLLKRQLGQGVGPSSLDFEVYSQQRTEPAKLFNVFGTIPGIVKEQLIVGNHRDALVLGAANGNSGSAVMLEIARVLGEMYKKGWRPYRSIVFASWDGGLHGMLGSTAWATENKHKLRKRTATYIDIGAAYTGPEFVAKASPLLRKLVKDCAERVPSPRLDDSSMLNYWESGSHGHAHVGTLSTGDFSPFYNHLGVPSLTAQFQSNETTHVYHAGSNYDTINWQKSFADSKFEGHAALARLLGLATANLASTPVLPLRVVEYARVIQRNVLLMLGEREEEEITALHDASSQFVIAATDFDRRLNSLSERYILDYPWYKFWKKLQLGIMMRVANFKLMYLESKFLHQPGLTSRPWYKHAFIGPDIETGETQVLPGIQEALRRSDLDELFYWVGVSTDCLISATSWLA